MLDARRAHAAARAPAPGWLRQLASRWRTASTNARELRRVLDARARPRRRSRRRRRTARTAAIASATLSGVQPAAEDQRHVERRLAASAQSNVSPVPPAQRARGARRAGGSRCGSARASLHVGARRRTRAALITLRAGAPARPRRSTPGPRRRGAGPCVSAERVGGRDDLVERRVDEHAAARRGGAAPRRSSAASPGRSARGEPGQRIMPSAHAPSSTAQLGVLEAGDAADLDVRPGHDPIVEGQPDGRPYASPEPPASAAGRRPASVCGRAASVTLDDPLLAAAQQRERRPCRPASCASAADAGRAASLSSIGLPSTSTMMSPPSAEARAVQLRCGCRRP